MTDEREPVRSTSLGRKCAWGVPGVSYGEICGRLDAEEARYLGALEGRLALAFAADPAVRG